MVLPTVVDVATTSCYYWCLADVIANWQMLLSRYRLMLLPVYWSWLMLLPLLADVNANCVEFGWCYCQLTDVIVKIQADVIACLLIMADVIAIVGRCYCQCVEMLNHIIIKLCSKCDGWYYYLVADGMATAGWLGRCYCHGSDIT